MDTRQRGRVEADARAAVSRREFLHLAAAAGLLGPVAMRSMQEAKPSTTSLATGHLAQGLAALSDCHRRGWLQGHNGAAVLASWYFCRDNALDERTTQAIRKQIDAFVESRPVEFPTPDPGSGTADPAKIIEQLELQIPQLRSGGHDVIYSALALRALRDLPEFATPKIVDGVCDLLRNFSRTRAPVPDTDYNRDHPLPDYGTASDVATVTFEAALRPWSHVQEVGASGVLHWITHAEALVTLEELGYGEVARRGHAPHRLNMNRPVAASAGSEPDRAAVDWLGPAYWESDAPRQLFSGTWLAGHAFKLPFSLFHLLRCTDDVELRKSILLRASHLLVPFE